MSDDTGLADATSFSGAAGPADTATLAARAGPSASTAAFSVRQLRRADLSGCAAWPLAFAGHRKDHRYYEIVEDTLRDGFDYGYLAIQDATGVPRAVQPFFLLDQDILEGLGPLSQRWLTRIRRLFPRFLKLRTLMVGCAAGEGHLAGSASLSQDQVAEILSREIINQAAICRASLIVLKEFPACYRTTLDCFVRRGFTRAPSMPMTTLNISYDSFESFMSQSLSRSTRWQLRKKFKATAGEIIHLSVADNATPAIDEIHALYRQVLHRSKFRFEILTPDYFSRVGRDMNDNTRFLLWRRGPKLVAFCLCMVEGDTLCWEYVGLDYTVALDLHLYYRCVRDMMMWAIDNGYKRLRSTGLSYEPKFRMGHRLDPLDLYARHTSKIANVLFGRMLPWIVPARYDKALRQFENYRDLW